MSQKNFQSAKIALLKMITTETFENNRLPSEAALAKKLRVSIVTLRQALSLLAAEGYITKRQGLGNFVHESALNQHMRTDLTYCVENLLLISGYHVQIEALSSSIGLANIEEAVDLKIDNQSPMLQLQILTRADGIPAALEVHRIPKQYFKHELPKDLEVLKLEEFLWDYCERELAHEMTSWIPTVVDERFSTLFDLPQGSAMLYWEELLYDTDDTPVCHTHTYFNPKIIKPRSLRKWNFGPRLDEKL